MARLVFLLILLSLLLSAAIAADSDVGFRLRLNHIDAKTGYTKLQLLLRAIGRSKVRVAALQTMATVASTNPITAARILVRASEGEYLMDLAIGMPPRYYSAILDTGSDLIWTQCAPCLLCVEQPTPYFQPTQSATFKRVPCSSLMCNALPYPVCYQNICVYQYSYGDSASTAGVLANEMFTFGTNNTKVIVPNIAFGCGNLNEGSLANSSGMVGFGRGPLSLVSQLGPSRFSYCLTSFLSPTPSRLYFGSFATLNSTNTSSTVPIQSTPFIINPALPSMHYLSLKGITVGTSLLPIDPSVFALNDDGTGGVIIDSGTSITYLQQDAYDVVHDAFISLIKLPVVNDTTIGLDTCFPWPPPPNVTVTIPEFVLHFDGADMALPPENYMLIDSSTGFLCLAMAASGDGSIIGNYQQQNMHILYDLANSFLSFVPAPCNLM